MSHMTLTAANSKTPRTDVLRSGFCTLQWLNVMFCGKVFSPSSGQLNWLKETVE